jgi:hypothetical protein
VSNTLVIGLYKTGTTIVAFVIEHSLPGAKLYFWRSAPERKPTAARNSASGVREA